MRNQTEHGPLIGNLQIWTIEEDKRQKVLIYGDPKGLESFGNILIALSKVNQEEILDMPNGFRDHMHIYPDSQLSRGSVETIIGRLDGKGTYEFPPNFIGDKR